MTVRRSSIAVLATVFVLVSCQSGDVNSSASATRATSPADGGARSSSSDPTASTSSRDDRSGLALPDVSARDRAVLMVATENLVADCMSRQGFQFVPIDLATAEEIAAAREDDQRLNSPIDQATEADGYIPQRSTTLSRKVDNDAYANSLTPAARDTWTRAALGNFDDVVTLRGRAGRW